MNSDGKLYLRNGTGKVFGPVTFSTLQQWACDGRVEPTAEVSEDLENWLAAPNIPGLGMEWVVENNPGQFYGPTHRTVIDDFIKSGSLVPGARFYRDMRSGLAEKAELEAAARDELKAAKAEAESLRTKATEADALREALAKAAEETQRSASEVARHKAAQAKAERDLDDARGRLLEAASDCDSLRNEVATLRPIKQQLDELREKHANLVAELEEKDRRYGEEVRKAVTSQRGLEEAQAEIATLKSAKAAIEKAREDEASKAAGTLRHLDATQGEVAALRVAQEKLVHERDEMRVRITQEQQARAASQEALEKVQRHLKELTSEADALRAALAGAENEKAAVAARAAEARNETESVKAELTKAEKERDTLKAELEDLRKVPEKREDVLVPEVIIADEPPPKPASNFSHTGNGASGASPLGGIFGGNISSLADLERQAQAELARMRASGGKGFFGFGKKK
ncbi:MAG: hypothetical protein MJ240_02940 [Kiritimatiellae bacterium]|nr:hypothetical protein [Kiritimatiellia bacterium]